MAMTFGPELATCIEDALRAAGADPAPAFEAMGLEPAELRSPDLGQTALMVRTAATHCSDPSFGLHVAERVRVTPFELAAYIAESRWTAREALALGDVFLQSKDTAAHFVTDDEKARWSVDPIDGRVDRHAAEFALACLTGAAFRALSGWRPETVFFRHPRPSCISEHLRIFRVEPRFEAPIDGVECLIEWMDLPLSPDPALLREAIDRQMVAFHHRVPREERVAERVRELIAGDLIRKVPSRDEVAAELGMSARTLQRRLDREGWTYSRLLDEIRRQAALEALLDPNTTIARACYELGFATEAAFYRAFKRWTGRTPSAYRRSMGDSPHAPGEHPED